ncbi:ABC transporter permease [Lonsdalea iberica]|uniref:ABC transporter substrate-binding protein n=1 Tax=Lonsdalea iberica TaxID=1082703 RepID=A0A1X3RUI5_9GAMM|nr:FtsX-like permease family protein [Lonsdalea iberica]OSN05533.1 ABC transporter substrate-binding protein [Lonsdalea iberica]
MIPWPLLGADVRRLWPGMLVVMLLIALATALSIAVSLQERALQQGSARAADRFDLVIGAPGSETQLVLSSVFLQPSALTLIPASVLDTLAHHPLVEWAAPVAFGDFYQGMPVVGTTAPLVTDNGKRALQNGRGFEQDFDAVVGAHTGLKPGDTFSPIHGRVGESGAHAHEHVHYTVVGVLPEDGSAWDRAILVPVAAVWRVHGIAVPGHERDDEEEHHHDGDEAEANHAETQAGVPAIVVKPKSIAGAYQLRAQFRTDTTLAVFPGEVLVKLYGILGDIRLLLDYVAMGTEGLVGIAVAMVAVLHLHQRRRQIGALRAFGAPRSGIFLLVWSGLMLLVSAGILAGVGLGYLAAKAIAVVMSEKSGFVLPVTLGEEDIQFSLLLLVIAAVVLTVPAMLSWRHSPAEALREA